jgi:hypothetical protein
MPRERYPYQASVEGLGQQIQTLVLSYKIPKPETEYRFWEGRKYQFDFAWPDKKVAIEYEGGIYSHLGHTRVGRFVSDMEKYNEAAILGWTVLRFGPDETRTGKAMNTMLRVLPLGLSDAS